MLAAGAATRERFARSLGGRDGLGPGNRFRSRGEGASQNRLSRGGTRPPAGSRRRIRRSGIAIVSVPKHDTAGSAAASVSECPIPDESSTERPAPTCGAPLPGGYRAELRSGRRDGVPLAKSPEVFRRMRRAVRKNDASDTGVGTAKPVGPIPTGSRPTTSGRPVRVRTVTGRTADKHRWKVAALMAGSRASGWNAKVRPRSFRAKMWSGACRRASGRRLGEHRTTTPRRGPRTRRGRIRNWESRPAAGEPRPQPGNRDNESISTSVRRRLG